jgi:hypothetical protein
LRRLCGGLAWPLAAGLVVLGLYEVGNRMVHAHTRLGERVAEVQEVGVGDVVVFGNSIADKALDAERLGSAFEPSKRVSSFASDGNNIPHWYALLVGEVYEKGYRPEVVVIYANWGVHGRTILESGEAESDFFGLAASSHPLVVENFFDGDLQEFRSQRVQASRFQVREALMDGLVEGGTAAFMGRWLQGAQYGTRGRAEQELAKASQTILFSPEAQTRRSVLPTQSVAVGDIRKNEEKNSEELSPLSGLLPHFVALAQTYGARTVLVLAPRHPRVRPQCNHRTGLEHFVERLETLPVDIVDLTYLPVPSQYFMSSSHLKPSGKPMATDALARGLFEVGAFSETLARPVTAWSWPCTPQSDLQVSLAQ